MCSGCSATPPGVVPLSSPIMARVTGEARMVSGLRVTPETVLGVHEVIMEEVYRLRTAVWRFQNHHRAMPALGSDPVSPHAAKGFIEATDLLLDRCRASIADLAAIGDQLAQAARAYGKSEAEIRASLNAASAVPFQSAANVLGGQDVPAPLRRVFEPLPTQRPPASSLGDLMRGGQ
jgi:hypothetical protein